VFDAGGQKEMPDNFRRAPVDELPPVLPKWFEPFADETCLPLDGLLSSLLEDVLSDKSIIPRLIIHLVEKKPCYHPTLPLKKGTCDHLGIVRITLGSLVGLNLTGIFLG